MGIVGSYVELAPLGSFKAAPCLLTLHFLGRVERVQMLRDLHQRLKSEAPLVVNYSSFPQQEPARARWLERHAAFANASGNDPAQTGEQGVWHSQREQARAVQRAVAEPGRQR